MNYRLMMPLVSAAFLIPMAACGSQRVNNNNIQQVQGQPVKDVSADKTKNAEISEITSMLEGEWIIKQVGSTVIDREENYPYINFVPAEDSFYASNGCNILNGVFTIDAPNTLTFHNVTTTMRYCPDTPFDMEINAVIADERPVKFIYEVVDGEPMLYFQNTAGQRVLTMHKPGLDFMNGNWKVASINGEEFDNDEMSIFFDMEARKVHGNTGCNSFNGDIYVDPQNKRVFSLTNMLVTMRMCPNIEQQSKFLVALEQTHSAKVLGNKQIALVNADGKTVMVLKIAE